MLTLPVCCAAFLIFFEECRSYLLVPSSHEERQNPVGLDEVGFALQIELRLREKHPKPIVKQNILTRK